MLQQFKKRNVSEKEESQKLRQRKQSKSRFGRRSKSKKKPPKPPKSKKRSKTMSVGKDWNYGFNPIDIDSLPSPKTSKSKMNSMAKTQSFDEELRRKVGAFKLNGVQKEEPLVSVYDAFIVQFGEYPQTAEALVEFSKIDGRFQALNLMDAQRIIAENVQRQKEQKKESPRRKTLNDKKAANDIGKGHDLRNQWGIWELTKICRMN